MIKAYKIIEISGFMSFLVFSGAKSSWRGTALEIKDQFKKKKIAQLLQVGYYYSVLEM